MTPARPGDSDSRASVRTLPVSVDIAGWVDERSPGIAERWASGLLANGESWAGDIRPVARPLCRGLVSFLPGMLGAYRAQILPLWSEGAELFGSVAARRGLSAGEVIEEFQLLREVILRMMFERPPTGTERGLPLREILHLNRAVDIGVTQASVGHTDLLFFSLIHDSGVPAPLGADDLIEVCEQIRVLQGDGQRIMVPRPG
ncbi:MAG: hypothetical protein OXN18_04985 [Gemmatimonadota bacterium]|nr:hypothetical protein [Gemmatimonadota bacterium]